MTENKRYEKRMNFNVSLPDERCFKNEYCIVDEARDRYEALSINELVDRLNEQDEIIQILKKTMKSVAELLSIEVDLFSDKATEHDINAYIELKKFDNKDAYYMAVSIKKAIEILKGDCHE